MRAGTWEVRAEGSEVMGEFHRYLQFLRNRGGQVTVLLGGDQVLVTISNIRKEMVELKGPGNITYTLHYTHVVLVSQDAV